MTAIILAFPLTDERKTQIDAENTKLFEMSREDPSTTNLTFAKPVNPFISPDQLSKFIDKVIHHVSDLGELNSFILENVTDTQWFGKDNFSPFRKRRGLLSDVNITDNHNAHRLFPSYTDAWNYSIELSVCPLHRAELEHASI